MSMTFLIGAVLGSGAAIAFGRDPLQKWLLRVQAARLRK
jgi:hypothetical protein